MLIKIAVAFLAAFLGLFSACTLVLFQAGIGSVYIDNKDLTLWLPLPMAFADLGLWALPEREIQDVRDQLAPVKDLALTTLQALQNSPDAILVEVKTFDESVLVQKEGNDVVIKVDSRVDGKVHVELPLHSLERILRKLAG
jgi:hypothetical protein